MAALIDLKSDYDDSAPWATTPDGDGFTLVIGQYAIQQQSGIELGCQQRNQWNTPGVANNVSPDGGSAGTTISVFAAGVSANEIVELEVDGVRVASFNIGANGGNAGDYSSRDFTELVWQSDVPITPSDVRVYFVNDRYDVDNDIDYDVRIDKIEIDGLAYESESPETFASGVWIDGQGISSGFFEKDRLNVNGFFDYNV